jgi:hypothetical protein
MPTHNVGPRIRLNILNVCSLASDNLEVVIRDNSGDASKREFLQGMEGPNCRIIIVDECPGPVNTRAAITAATGEFVFFAADDDHVNSFGIPTLQAEIQKIVADPAIVGTSGIIVVDDGKCTTFQAFNRQFMPEPIDRLQGLLYTQWPSVFQYAPVRRNALMNVWKFASRLPVFVCYHDLLMNCLCLLHGRITYNERFIYQYFNTNWSNPELLLKSETASFVHAGIDASAVRLQWLIAAFEGAQAFLCKYTYADVPSAQRELLAQFWLQHWLARFTQSAWRQGEGGKFDAQALALALKWLVGRSSNLNDLLTDIAGFYALSSTEIAQRYFEFWR